MGYARHIGRVGALAVTLGVGVALASPGVAYAEPSSTSSTSDTSSTSASSSTDGSARPDKRSVDRADRDDSDDSEASGQDSTSDADADDDDDDDADEDSAATDDDRTDDEDTSASDEDEVGGDEAGGDEAGGDEGAEQDPVSDRLTSTRSAATEDVSPPEDSSEPVQESVAADTGPGAESTPATFKSRAVAAAAPAVAAAPAATPEPSSTVVQVASAAASPALQPLAEHDPEAPLHTTAVMAVLAAVRDELERNTLRRSTNMVAPQAVSLFADPSPNVLLIGVDGANLSRVLDDPTNSNFFGLIQDGTTAPASIAGHTTISNPSWSSILTGAWGEKTGVINNIFTPGTYDNWPTVFNQLETLNPDIQTTAIANWNVISAIAAAGSAPADTVINVSQVPGDTNWLLTDDAVGDATEAAIAAADASTPNFLFSYFVGVDENGHLYGGASPEYAEALNNFDRNLGEILQAVSDWEALTGEQWTVIMVTDHGHQPQKGLGHGFQSPDETSTFVIAENPDIFAVGAINLQYEIVDVTPTVVTLFGGTPTPDADGVSLTDLGDSNVVPVNDDDALRGALQDAIDMYGYPDLGTQIALGVRTVFASVPYFVDEITIGITSTLQGIADLDIFLISPLAALAIVPVQFIGDLVYVATNVVAQIVARLTGVTGASIFPLWPPAPPSFPSTPEEATMLDALMVCGSPGSAQPTWCGDALSA
ncbi:alkaline phosphatase family protein [Mycolicibacterium hippocampi]|uniref:alkaline phosphatase family protein n=1 Tax=Mycolicibacterium hippocampi TaxID=659824 RepID=UPI00351240B4